MHEYKINELIDNTYVIDQFLSNGGMNSSIFIVHHKDNAKLKLVAKIIQRNENIDDDTWAKFEDEAVTSQRVNNKPNLVQTYDIRELNNQEIIFIMEYIDGLSLRSIIAQNGKLPLPIAIDLFHKILIGIKNLHSFKHQIIHRDLKPENILISHDLQTLKIIDFGISTVVTSQQCLTNEKNLFGTCAYICPDILQIKKNSINNIISVQFDFFSLGIIFYEMLVGIKPFLSPSENAPEILRLPLRFDLPCLSSFDRQIPTSIENIIFRCIACQHNDLKYRYNSIDQIIEDLEKAKNNLKFNPPLLKPISCRRLQSVNLFNHLINKNRIPITNKWWCLWLLLTLTIFFAIFLFFLWFVVK